MHPLHAFCGTRSPALASSDAHKVAFVPRHHLSGISSYESGGPIPGSLPSASSAPFSPSVLSLAVGFIYSLPPGPCAHWWFPRLSPEFQACESQCLLDIPSRYPQLLKGGLPLSSQWILLTHSVSEFTKARNLGVTVAFSSPSNCYILQVGNVFYCPSSLQLPPPLYLYSLDLTIVLKIYLFLTVLGLHCCMQAFSSCREQRLLSSCGAWGSWAFRLP